MTWKEQDAKKVERNSRLVSEALAGGSLFTGLGVERRIGVVLLWGGVAALFFSFVAPVSPRWIWVAVSLVVAVVGGCLMMVGAKLNSSETWPTFGPH